MSESGIYLIRNILNGKKYVGSTLSTLTSSHSTGFKNRWYKHKWCLSNDRHENKHLQSAWNKYGKDSFEFLIIEYCQDSEIQLREQAWINYYDSMNRVYGYNLQPANKHDRNPHHSEVMKLAHKNNKKLQETTKKMVAKRMELINCPIYHKKLSDTKLRDKNPNFNKGYRLSQYKDGVKLNVFECSTRAAEYLVTNNLLSEKTKLRKLSAIASTISQSIGKWRIYGYEWKRD